MFICKMLVIRLLKICIVECLDQKPAFYRNWISAQVQKRAYRENIRTRCELNLSRRQTGVRVRSSGKQAATIRLKIRSG